MSAEEPHWDQINRTTRNADARKMLGISAAAANRILAGFVEEDKIQKTRIGKFQEYTVR